ncbi:Bacterial extracellular solute-binding protein, family 3 [Pseudodesulfovibrio hydrargyri]|uniref:Bacterial extracellular solute-binding protein, family 3 n=1 Tax=Pseudodesulfovibrio hydrargyri TaxID=2125990 RepID=A0A1J5N3J4_9BACT|nr:transporter substrate-binding domain-containing protein [Pseudodesulfovibrio hydrargyri]OIQ50187.1 Bacterial extracellular solute-binding protein, family 3 [Pseudodesulfovibrio hydrargyri]
MPMNPLRIFTGALFALFLAARLAAAGAAPVSDAAADNWDAVPVCVFGMPEAGYAVSADDSGYVTEVLRAALAPAGYDLVYKDMPYLRARGDLAEGRIQCSLSSKGETKRAAPARSVIAACDLSVAYIAADGFSGIKDLTNQKVAHLYGFDFQQLLPVPIRPQTTYDRTSAIHMLDRGHARYVVGEESMLKDAIRETGLPLTEFGFSRFMSLDVVPVFAPNAEGYRLRDIFDKRMAEMAASGELAAIFRKYGLSEERIRHILKSDTP